MASFTKGRYIFDAVGGFEAAAFATWKGVNAKNALPVVKDEIKYWRSLFAGRLKCAGGSPSFKSFAHPPLPPPESFGRSPVGVAPSPFGQFLERFCGAREGEAGFVLARRGPSMRKFRREILPSNSRGGSAPGGLQFRGFLRFASCPDKLGKKGMGEIGEK